MAEQQERGKNPEQPLFSERVIKAIEFTQTMESAENYALELNHTSIETDHLLFGLMQNPLINATLLKFNIHLDKVRKSIEFIFGTGEIRLNRQTRLRLSNRAKRVIEIAGQGKISFQEETPLIDLLRAIILDQDGRGAIILGSVGLYENSLSQVISTYMHLKEWKLP